MPNLISLEVNGKSYTNFENYSIEKNIENLCGTFDVTISASDQFGLLPIRPNDAIKITIDGESIITGYVDQADISYNTDSHSIKLIGRDKTADFVDSILESKTFNPPISFEELLKRLLILVGYNVVDKFTRIGLTTFSNKIAIINNYGIIPVFTDAEGIQLRYAESAYELIKRCAEKRQLVLNSDGDGNIVINKIGAEKALTILQNLKNSDVSNNNIKNASVRYAWQDRYYTYVIKSMTTQGNQSTFNNPSNNSDFIIDPISATPQIGTAIDHDVRTSRIYTAIANSATTSADCKKRAEWEANIRKTQGFTYYCEVVGFRQNLNELQSLGYVGNPLWKPNQIVYVNDEFAGIDNELLIKSVNYSQDLNGGSISKLELVDKLAYSTSIFEPLLRRKKQTNAQPQVLFAQ